MIVTETPAGLPLFSGHANPRDQPPRTQHRLLPVPQPVHPTHPSRTRIRLAAFYCFRHSLKKKPSVTASSCGTDVSTPRRPAPSPTPRPWSPPPLSPPRELIGRASPILPGPGPIRAFLREGSVLERTKKSPEGCFRLPRGRTSYAHLTRLILRRARYANVTRPSNHSHSFVLSPLLAAASNQTRYLCLSQSRI